MYRVLCTQPYTVISLQIRNLNKGRNQRKSYVQMSGYSVHFVFKLSIKSLGVNNRGKENSKVILPTGFISFCLNIKSTLNIKTHILMVQRGKQRPVITKSVPIGWCLCEVFVFVKYTVIRIKWSTRVGAYHVQHTGHFKL